MQASVEPSSSNRGHETARVERIRLKIRSPFEGSAYCRWSAPSVHWSFIAFRCSCRAISFVICTSNSFAPDARKPDAPDPPTWPPCAALPSTLTRSLPLGLEQCLSLWPQSFPYAKAHISCHSVVVKAPVLLRVALCKQETVPLRLKQQTL